jgi:hypothetical protein
MLGAGEGLKAELRFVVKPEPGRCATGQKSVDIQRQTGIYLPLDRTTGLENPLAAGPAGLLTFRPALIPYPAKPDGPGLFTLRLASGCLGEALCCGIGAAGIPFPCARPIRGGGTLPVASR